MSRSVIWLIAILGVALIGIAAVHDRLPAIELDLRQRVELALERRGLDRRFDGLTITADGRDLRIAGAALTELDRQAALSTIARIGGVRRVIDDTVLVAAATPFLLRIARDTRGRIALSGAVPDAERRERLRSLLRAAAPGEIVDATVIRRGAPRGDWLAAAELAGELVLRLVEGEAVLADHALRLSGRVPDDAAADAIERSLQRRTPAGFAGAAVLETSLDRAVRGDPAGASIGEASACTALFADVIKASPLEFEAGNSLLTTGNRRTLARLVAVATRCAGFGIEIRAYVAQGSADSAAVDLRLADSRALTLLRYFVGAGIARARLSAQGFVDPAAPRGERIELNVRIEAIRGGAVGRPEGEFPRIAARFVKPAAQ